MATPRSWRRWPPAVIAAAAGLGVFGWLATGRPAEPAPASLPSAATAAPGARVEPPPAALAEALPGRPAGVSAPQWQALSAELRGRAGGPAELRRLAGYFEWSDTLRRFRAARATGASSGDLLAVARAVDAGLAERLRGAEVSAAEARQIKSAIVEVTEPDPSLRAGQLQAWAVATFAPATADPRQATFERRQSEIVAAWSAQPKTTRDSAALERQLDSLRRESFSGSAR